MPADQLSTTFGALADPTRRAILARLAQGEATVNELADGTQVRYGAARSMRAKNQVLAALLTELRAEGGAASYIDVRVPTSPAVSNAAPTTIVTPAPDWLLPARPFPVGAGWARVGWCEIPLPRLPGSSSARC